MSMGSITRRRCHLSICACSSSRAFNRAWFCGVRSATTLSTPAQKLSGRYRCQAGLHCSRSRRAPERCASCPPTRDLSLLPPLLAIAQPTGRQDDYYIRRPATAGHVKLCQHLGTRHARWLATRRSGRSDHTGGAVCLLQSRWIRSGRTASRRERLRPRRCRSLRRCDSESGQTLDPRIGVEPTVEAHQPGNVVVSHDGDV